MDNLWARPSEDNPQVMLVGFTPEFLQHLSDNSYGIMISSRDRLRAGESFGTVEMSYGTECLYSPISGRLLSVIDDIYSRLDKVTPESIIFRVAVQGNRT